MFSLCGTGKILTGVEQVFYLSSTEAQFDNLKLETVPKDQDIQTDILFQQTSFHSMKPPEV